jgi:asparagine N-glycosylation enzyme membrane subunit Stt3
LAGELGVTEQRVRTALLLLEGLGIITSNSTNRYSIITIVKYEEYQNVKDKVASNSTNKQPTNNQQITTKQEEDNKRTKEYNKAFESIWLDYPKNRRGDKAKVYRLVKKLDIDILRTALNTQKRSVKWNTENGQYIPKFEKWIREEQYKLTLPLVPDRKKNFV